MKEIFVIYNKDTGFINGGAGRVDRNATPDGSTMAERIPEILAKDDNRAVVYFPNQVLPNPKTEKIDIKTGKVIDKTKEELAELNKRVLDECVIRERMREMAIADLGDELPAGYK